MSILKNMWTGFVSAINTEYDRRIRAASNVRAYHIGGHDHHHGAAAHDHHDLHEQAHDDHHIQPTQAIGAPAHEAEHDAPAAGEGH